MSTDTKPWTSDNIRYLIDHIALPPQLPQGREDGAEEMDAEFVDLLLHAFDDLKRAGVFSEMSRISHVTDMLERCRACYSDGELIDTTVKESLASLEAQDFLILPITAQNAALFVHSMEPDNIIIEAFEATPSSEAVLASRTGLLRSFPGCAVAVPKAEFFEPQFQAELATWLEKASSKPVTESYGQTTKGGVDVVEVRDTIHPKLITDCLMSMLEAFGQRVAVEQTHKHTYDEVVFCNPKLPWRRSMIWLVLRVAVQRSLSLTYGADMGTQYYKTLTAVALGKVCSLTLTNQFADRPHIVDFLRKKLGRRLYKMRCKEQDIHPLLESNFQSILSAVETWLSQQWQEIQEKCQKTIPILPQTHTPQDLCQSLRHSGAHLHDVVLEPLQFGPPGEAHLNSELPLSFDNIGLPVLPTHLREEEPLSLDVYLMLADFENWTRESAHAWASNTKLRDIHYAALGETISRYLKCALHAYDKQPQQRSMMLLTALHLWMILDECTCKLHPLLLRFRPEITISSLEILLLPERIDMQPLHILEQYLQQRSKGSCSSPSVFDEPSSEGFACRYFRTSEKMMNLKKEIEQDALQEYNMKRVECEALERQYKLWMAEVEKMKHDFTYTLDGRREHGFCNRCQLKKRADTLEITAFEHPLPSSQDQAESVVFELCCPVAFGAWRDVTWFLIHDLGMQDKLQKRFTKLEKALPHYEPLAKYDQSAKQRITLASSVEPYMQTHYAKFKISEYKEPIKKCCVPNSMIMRIFDGKEEKFVTDVLQTIDFARLCNFTLPAQSPYHKLESAINATQHTPNFIEATQGDCPADIPLRTWLEFHGVRAIPSLQYVCLMRELASSNLDFNAEPTRLLVAATIWQAGPRDAESDLRANHAWLLDESFVLQFIVQIERRTVAVRGNYTESRCMDTMLILALRILDCASSKGIATLAVRVIRKIRLAAANWTKRLREEALSATDKSQENKLSTQLLSAALLCRRTFGMELLSAATTLEACDIATFFECGIIMRNNMPSVPANLPPTVFSFILRDYKLVRALESKLRSALVRRPNIPLSFLTSILGAPDSLPRWSHSPHPNERWITTTISCYTDRERRIHYNMLDSQVLLDGHETGRLPTAYITSKIYQQVFGNRNLSVFPSDMIGMEFSAAYQFEGHNVYFGRRGEAIIIRCTKDQHTYELIPRDTFFGVSAHSDLPNSLVRHHVHWLDLNDQILHIRKLPICWSSDSETWKLDMTTSEIKCADNTLVNRHGDLFKKFATVFAHFETANDISVVASTAAPGSRATLHVDLSRYELSFFCNDDGVLESKELNATIDLVQDVGSFIGLKTKLVLADLVSDQKSVLIPRGLIKSTRDSDTNHVSVIVEPEGTEYATCCRYTINDILHRIDSAYQLRDIYTKALLHALTSYLLVDPLTGRTGTSEALHCLGQAQARPLMPLDKGCAEILSQLAELTPTRLYYPAHLKVMVTVSWTTELLPSSQPTGFRLMVDAIRQHSNHLERFYPRHSSRIFSYLHGDLHLVHRAKHREDLFHAPSSSRLETSITAVPIYLARDLGERSERGAKVSHIASLTKSWQTGAGVQMDIWDTLKTWNKVDGFHSNFGYPPLNDLLTLKLPQFWGSLYRLCQENASASGMYRLLFLFCTVAYGEDADTRVISTLLAVAITGITDIHPPEWTQYVGLKDSYTKPDQLLLEQFAARYMIAYVDNRSFTNEPSANELAMHAAREQLHTQKSQNHCRTFVVDLLSQWPCKVPRSRRLIDSEDYFDIDKAYTAILPEWTTRYQNHQLHKYVQLVQERLDRCNVMVAFSIIPKPPSMLESSAVEAAAKQKIGIPSLLDLLTDNLTVEPVALAMQLVLHTPNASQRSQALTNNSGSELRQLLDNTAADQNEFGQNYINTLIRSSEAWDNATKEPALHNKPIRVDILRNNIDGTKLGIGAQLDFFRETLRGEQHHNWLCLAGLLPEITPVTLLELLSNIHRSALPDVIKSTIVRYGTTITDLQRLVRIRRLAVSGNTVQIAEELRNPGHVMWQPVEYPDWLLLEIETDILIREEQYQVAVQMLSPESNTNSLLQLNMGKGKSSVIVPMVCAVLADATRVVRVLVIRPLLQQMAQLLGARLGGLLGRTIYHIPFSRRDSSTDCAVTKAFLDCHKSIQTEGAVLLTLPEHVLSFKLIGLDLLDREDWTTAKPLLEAKDWLDKNCRDVLDESDHILSPRMQLIYPTGAQSMVDHHPFRWQTIQSVLALVKSLLPQVQTKFSEGFDVTLRAGFDCSIVRVFDDQAKEAMLRMLVEAVSHGEGSILPHRGYHSYEVENLKRAMGDVACSETVFSDASACLVESRATKDLLLLRGLFAHKILPFCLEKRWNVNYGLHFTRTPSTRLAVPYQAKGKPAEQSDFGHSDVAIILTCLSYYYAGLTLENFREAVEVLLKQDDPAVEYDTWAVSAKLLQGQNTWNTINLDDEVQILSLWSSLRYNWNVINFFLNSFVFPREAKQFETKLASSGFDIPQTAGSPCLTSTTNQHNASAARMAPVALTTGFSGTNDNRFLLPSTIAQVDMPQLMHTNGEVLSYLLEQRNRTCVAAVGPQGQRLQVPELLDLIIKQIPRITVVLDAGAQILEMGNLSFVKLWMQRDKNARAAVFFSKDDKLMVLRRDGRTETLMASTFKDDLSGCLVYLDEAHTRGTDLKLPATTRAALTVGPKQLKDEVLQAVMRLRQLAHKQSVVWFLPPEVHREISKTTESDIISSPQVITWLLKQTIAHLNLFRPLHVHQGLSFYRRQHAARVNADNLDDPAARKNLLSMTEEKELATLAETYEPGSALARPSTPCVPDGSVDGAAVARLQTMRDAMFADGSMHQASAHEEQEREVAVEVQVVQQVQRPPNMKPAKHELRQDVVTFARWGLLTPGSSAYTIAFNATDGVSKKADSGTLCKSEAALFATRDHLHAVDNCASDEYHRAVHWLIWHKQSPDILLIISPFEAEKLLPELAKSTGAHLLTYAAPAARSMVHFSDLKFFSYPPLTRGWTAPARAAEQLSIFAGAIYFKYDDYASLSSYLGLEAGTAPRTATAQAGQLCKKPLVFLREWLAVRRKGQDFSRTPMGYVCRSRKLGPTDPFFAVGADGW